MALAVFAFVGTSNVTNAQCSKSKTASTVSGKKSCAASCASKLAANDASIEKQVCEKSGKVSYVRKATCEKSGKTSLMPVQYDAASKKFVNVSPAADVQLVSGGEKKMCAKSAAAAAKLAANDETIESKVCEKSGKVSYFTKSTCAKSGKTSMSPVKYCSDSKKFVNVAPAADIQLVGGGSNAELVAGEKKSCAKSCAAKLASNDASIEKKVCEKSGKVSYMRKATCAKSGKTSMTPVMYDATSKKFVNVSPEGGGASSQLVAGEKKACSKKAGLVGDKKACAKSSAAAAKLASNDEGIEAKVCEKSGKVSYFAKQTCAKSGKTSMTPVKYCSDSKKFVNVSPEGEAKSTLTGSGMKACCANAKKAGGKACCSGKKACSGKVKGTKASMQGSQK